MITALKGFFYFGVYYYKGDVVPENVARVVRADLVSSKPAPLPISNGVNISEIEATFESRVRAALHRGDERIKRMALKPSYDPPVMAGPPTFTETPTLDAALTKSWSQNRTDIFKWDAPNPTGSTPIYWTYADGTGNGASVPIAQVRFNTDSDKFAIQMYSRAGQKFRLWVNEERVSTSPLAATIASATSYLNVDFGATSTGTRRIVLEIESTGGPIQFFGLKTKPGATVTAPTITSPRTLLVGDSFGVGAGALSMVDSYGRTLGRMLGLADFWTNYSSLSASGMVHAPSAIAGNYRSRLVPDVIPANPDMVIIQGSQNDRPHASAGTITPAIVEYVNTLKAALPKCVVILVGVAWVANPDATLTSINDQWRTAAAQLKVPFIDLFAPNQVFTGTGNTSTPTGDGNADRYRNPDNSHPSQAGHYALAQYLAGRIRELV